MSGITRLEPLDAALPGTGVPGSPHERSAMTIRRAVPDDGPRLRAMHRASLRRLGAGSYSPALIDRFLAEVGTLDDALLAEGTCLVIESDGAIAASGAWTLGAQALDRARPPAAGPVSSLPRAAIRSVFTDPHFVRRGLASTIMRLCEAEAAKGDRVADFELYATLSGLPLYRRFGYRAVAPVAISLSDGNRFDAVFMTKRVGKSIGAASAACRGSAPTTHPVPFIEGTRT